MFGRLHPDDYDHVAGAIQASALTLQEFFCEFRVNLPRQGLRWRWSQAHPERLPDGGTLWHGIISDITERKLAEEALRASEAQFRTLTTLAPIGIYLTDVRGHCRYANPRWCEMTGLTLDEALGDGWTRGLHPEDREAVFASWQKTVESQGSWGLEYRFRTPDGRITWVHGLAAPQLDAAGRISGYVGANVDISERKRAEEALTVSEARSKALLRTIPDLLFRVDRDCIFLDYQAETKHLYAQSEPTLIGKRCRDVLPPEFVELIETKIRLALESGALQTFEYQLPVPGLGVRSYEARMAASGADEVTAIIRDITDSHQAQRELRATEERWRDILFSMADWVWEVDAKGVYTYSSEKGERLLGYSRQEIIGKTPFDFMPPEEAARVGPIFGEIASRKGIVRDLENWNIDKSGKRICLLTNGVPILDPQGNLLGYRGVDRDITERKLAEERMKSALSFQQALLDAVPSPIFYKDANFAYIGGNKAFERYIGLTREQFVGKTVHDIAPADLAERYDRADRELLKKTGVQTYEGVVVYADGTRHDVIFNKAIFNDAEGRTAGMIGVILDITERLRSEEALRQSEIQQSNALQMTKAGHWEYDVDSDRFTFNDNFYRIFHTTAVAVGGYHMSAADYARRFCHPDDAAQVGAETQAAIASSDPDYSRQVEHRILYADGGIGHIAVRFFIVKDPQGRTVKTYGVNQDISERKRAEQALQESINDFRGYFNMGTVGVCVTSPTASWIEVNDRLCSMLGYSREELLEKNWIDLTHADDADADLELFREVLAGQRDAYELEKRFVRKDGRIIHTRLYATCQRNPDRSVHHFLASLVDITEQKLAEQAVLESKERYEGFIAQSSDGVYRLEMDVPMPLDLPLEEQIDHMYHHLRIAECNPVFLEMYGVKGPEEILGKTLLEMHGGVDNPVNRQTSRQFILSGYRIQHAVTEEVDTRGKRKHFSNNSIGILENGRLTRMWGTQTDISERVQMEAERRALQEIVQGVLASGNLREFLGLVHNTIARVVYAENFFVALYNNGTGLFEQAYIADKFDASFPPSKLEKSASSYVFRSGRPLLASRAIFAELEARGELELVGTDSPSWLGVPLITGEEAIGVMVVQDYERENRYTRRDLEFFVSIAGQVALAVEHKRTSEEVKRQLEEKSVLLKEVHHRIKNNFASIAGLLSLHMQASTSPEAVTALQDAIGRIDSMRLLYEKLLLGGDFQDASAKNYIESLAASVVSLFPELAKVKLSLGFPSP